MNNCHKSRVIQAKNHGGLNNIINWKKCCLFVAVVWQKMWMNKMYFPVIAFILLLRYIKRGVTKRHKMYLHTLQHSPFQIKYWNFTYNFYSKCSNCTKSLSSLGRILLSINGIFLSNWDWTYHNKHHLSTYTKLSK